MVQYAVKGSHIAQAQVCVDEKLGAGAFGRLAAELSGDACWEDIAISAWYDVFVLHRVLQIVCREVDQSMVSLTAEVARKNALADLNGIYRTFLRIAQPVRMLRFTPQLWRNYVGFANCAAAKNELGSFVAETTAFPEALIEWCCGSGLGFLPAGIELAGGIIDSAAITARVANGDASRATLSVEYHMK